MVSVPVFAYRDDVREWQPMGPLETFLYGVLGLVVGGAILYFLFSGGFKEKDGRTSSDGITMGCMGAGMFIGAIIMLYMLFFK